MKHGRFLLRAWINRMRLTDRAAADLLDIHKSSLSQLLSGRRLPGRALAVRIETATGIPVGAWTPTDEGIVTSRKLQHAGSR